MSLGSWRDTKGEMATGWRLVLTGFLGLALGTTGIFFYTQGIFIKPLQAEFGWTRAQVAAMPTIFGLTLAVSYPLMGLLLDRFGTRRVVSTSILCLSVGFFALSRMNGSLPLYIAIVLFIALCGSGTATGYVRLVGSGFTRARGLALGLAMTGTGLVAMITPAILGAYLQDHGWRAAYQALGMAAIVALPFVLVFATDAAQGPRGPSSLPGVTLRQAVRSRRFWLLGGGFAMGGAAVSGMLPHFVPMLQDAGMQPGEAGALAGAIGFAIIASRLLTGVLCDYFFAPRVAATVLSLSALGCLGLLLVGPGFAIPAALLIGLGLGAEIDLAGYMSARYFGLRAYGSILGTQFGLFGLGSGVGAMAFGIMFDRFGDYRVALATAAALLAGSVVCALLLGPYPEHKPAQ